MDKNSSAISIAMEFCEGGSLDSVYREVKKLGGRTGEKVLGKVAEGVLHGLTYLNSRKIIHRGRSFSQSKEYTNMLQTSSPRTSCSTDKAWSSSATLVSPANSARKARPTPLLAHPTTWRQNESKGSLILSPLMFGL